MRTGIHTNHCCTADAWQAPPSPGDLAHTQPISCLRSTRFARDPATKLTVA